jgi:hypothetical protein
MRYLILRVRGKFGCVIPHVVPEAARKLNQSPKSSAEMSGHGGEHISEMRATCMCIHQPDETGNVLAICVATCINTMRCCMLL